MPPDFSHGTPWIQGLVTILALGLALALRPWRGVGPDGPPWPWLAVWIVLPVFWGLDSYAGVTLIQPMSGASLLVLLAGWPLAILALLPVAIITMLAAHLEWTEALHRLVWLGVAPATLIVCIGAALRRWLPHHLFIYILGRGFFGTWITAIACAAAAMAWHPLPAGTDGHDVLIAHVLAGFGEAFLTGMLTAIFVAFYPHLLATYSDRIYLPPRPR